MVIDNWGIIIMGLIVIVGVAIFYGDEFMNMLHPHPAILPDAPEPYARFGCDPTRELYQYWTDEKGNKGYNTTKFKIENIDGKPTCVVESRFVKEKDICLYDPYFDQPIDLKEWIYFYKVGCKVSDFKEVCCGSLEDYDHPVCKERWEKLAGDWLGCAKSS
ncbi:hypothetical protein JW868_02860 [Candidatus Woesearchaeota archaeon]|nr:hypothetical protein [Candidatus Woesearchaeota archaeon]